jgi:hypothetical protein
MTVSVFSRDVRHGLCEGAAGLDDTSRIGVRSAPPVLAEQGRA